MAGLRVRLNSFLIGVQDSCPWQGDVFGFLLTRNRTAYGLHDLFVWDERVGRRQARIS